MKHLLFYLLLSIHFCYSQENFYGILLDASNQQPIPFAHFSFEKNHGFISNEKGEFQFTYTAKKVKAKISAIGYQNTHATLLTQKKNIVFLHKKTEHLEEVVINYEDPAKALIRKAVENIPKNYPTQHEQIHGSITENTSYDSLGKHPIYKINAFIKADKFSYAWKSRSGNVQVLNTAIETFDLDTLGVRFYGGAHSVHYDDYVLARKGPLTLRRLDDYKLSIKDTLHYDNQSVIQLDYRRNKSYGSFYIAADSYAILRVTYNKDPKEVKETGFNFLKTYERTFINDIVSYEKDEDDKWRLKFIYSSTGFKHLKKQKSLYIDGTFSATKHLPMASLIDAKDRFQFTGILSDYSIEIVKKEERPKLSTPQKMFIFLTKIRSETTFSYHPYQIQAQEHYFDFLEQSFSTKRNDKVVWASGDTTEYKLNNLWGLGYTTAQSFQFGRYRFDALSLSYQQDISKRNHSHLSLSLNIGHRKLRDLLTTFSTDAAYTYGGKTFDSGSSSLFLESRAWTINPKLGLSFRLHPFLHLGLQGAYYLPFASKQGLFLTENKEFWRWNRSRVFTERISEASIENNFSFGVFFILGF